MPETVNRRCTLGNIELFRDLCIGTAAKEIRFVTYHVLK